MPLTELWSLMEQARKRDIEHKLYLMWLSNFSVAQLVNAVGGALGSGELMGVTPFADVLRKPLEEEPKAKPASIKPAEQIQAEAMAAVARYEFAKEKGGGA